MNLEISRFFVLLSGLAHVVTRETGHDLWIGEGYNQLVIAVDTEGVGHLTYYPSDKPTVALQIPFKDGRLPDYKVLHEGACSSVVETHKLDLQRPLAAPYH